jgi:CRP-like cAMP-binding protein
MVEQSGRIPNPLVLKLSHFARLAEDDIHLLNELCVKEERIAAHVTFMSEGEPPRSAFVLTRGLVCRYRLLSDGRRQILSFLLPGDFYDLHLFLMDLVDHSVATIVSTRLAAVGQKAVFDLVTRPRLRTALWSSMMQEAAMMRERIVALGRRNARGRVAYLLCEFVWRYMAIGMNEGYSIRFPLTQTEIADSLGLTSVHVNRVLQDFRGDKLITLHRGRLTLHDVKRLQNIAEFSRDYLHLSGVTRGAQRYIDQLLLSHVRGERALLSKPQ